MNRIKHNQMASLIIISLVFFVFSFLSLYATDPKPKYQCDELQPTCHGSAACGSGIWWYIACQWVVCNDRTQIHCLDGPIYP